MCCDHRSLDFCSTLDDVSSTCLLCRCGPSQGAGQPWRVAAVRQVGQEGDVDFFVHCVPNTRTVYNNWFSNMSMLHLDGTSKIDSNLVKYWSLVLV